MHLPPVQPVSLSEIYVSGDVIIHDSAVVAPGTILQAAPNSRIIIGPGACIGMGVILNACQGAIEIETGAVLGSGVLMIGAGKIGKNACIGSLTTIYNRSVEPMVIISAGSLIGDSSRQINPVNGNGIPPQANSSVSNSQENRLEDLPPQRDQSPLTDPSEFQPELKEPELDPWTTEPSIDYSQTASTSDSVKSNSNGTQPEPVTDTEVEVSPQSNVMDSEEPSKQAPVVGQIYINQLLLTLFPDRRFFQNLEQKNQSHDLEGNSQ
ncbi:carbon dioxide concentrating mechanism protein [Gloeothece citriformis PCC 7424]|uniref:Carbon dioxide concentrating mechanism protein n=1 Tax=Gloeothece citriformis (strain PCC 7424) TaxID=65393 RepID=B7K7P4_GLOC7|nr:carbon dioxide concentrating mechanism protein [Gloeothece citriformis]ACK69812.1 carbon dioxide concentrating mechanism protein [Gloeothece citriformis PCC 7424]